MNDQFAGMGGSYRIDENGRKVLVERTDDPNNPPPPPTPETQNEPANSAGFFSPEAALSTEPAAPETVADQTAKE